MKPPPRPKSRIEAMLHQLGDEARRTRFDPALPLRVEAMARQGIESRSFEPALVTVGGLAAAVLIALGSWIAPASEQSSPPAQGGHVKAPTDAPSIETPEEVEEREREP